MATMSPTWRAPPAERRLKGRSTSHAATLDDDLDDDLEVELHCGLPTATGADAARAGIPRHGGETRESRLSLAVSNFLGSLDRSAGMDLCRRRRSRVQLVWTVAGGGLCTSFP